MKTKTLLGLSAVVLALGTASAAAGPCTTEIDNVTKTLAARDAGSGPTSGASAGAQSATNPSGEHPPTAVMGGQVAGKATSAEDVRRQTQGQPTAAQEGNTGRMAAGPHLSEATAALQRARELDGQGKEADCMASIRQARQLAEQK